MKKTGSMLFLFFTGALLAGNWNPLNSAKSEQPEIPKAAAYEIPTSFKHPAHANYKSQIGFEENKGQWPNQVQFKADLGNGKRLFFEKNKFTYNLYNADEMAQAHAAAHTHNKKEVQPEFRTHAFEMLFVNSNLSTELEATDVNDFHYNYYIGNDQSKWASDIKVYKKLSYKNLYEGIDLVAYQSENNLKYDYVVKAGAKASDIQLKFNGADNLEVRDKSLTILTSVGEVVESIPYAYQIIDGKEVEVACEYKLLRDGKTVVFNFPQGYDSHYELIIDPVLVVATFSGSTVTVYGHCATYDAAGDIYTGGRAFGTGYPVTTGAAQGSFGGGSVDICISKLNPTGSSLLYATYIGGAGEDLPFSMYVNSSNEFFVYGTTTSTNYPVSNGAYDNSYNGGTSGTTDMIVTKLNSTGTSLLGSTYIGGSANDGTNVNASTFNGDDAYRGEIVIGSAGDVFIVATTESTNFPVTTGAYDVSHNGLQDAVVLKMNSNLTSLTWATFLGGSGDEAGFGIRINAAGEIYVTGLTAGGFPIVTGAFTSTYQGGTYDGFIARLNSSGTSLLNSTYIGTGAMDIIYFVELDYAGDVYIYGITQGTFPVTFGVYFNANSLNFLQKLNSSLTTQIYTTMLGNGQKNSFSPSAFMVDLCLNVYMAGWGSVTGYSVTTSAIQATTTGYGFHIMVLGPNAQNFMYGTFFGAGGEHVDGGTSRFDPNGLVYQAMCEGNSGLQTTSGAYAPTKLSGYDIAVFKIDFQVNCNPLFTNTIICLGKTATINIANVNTLLNPTFSIQPGGTVSSSPSFTVSPSNTTNYTVFITGTNGFNTIVTNSGVATVSIATSPQVAPTFTQATCSSTVNAFDLNLSFVPTTATPTYVVFWSPIPYGVTTTSQSASTGGIAPGVYNATITAYPLGCKTSTSFTINPVPTSVSFSVAGASVINCFNPTVTLNVSPTTYSYNWVGLTGNYSGPSASFTLGQSGTWTVNATDPSSGCGGTHTFAISQDLSPSTSTVTPLLQNITCSVTSIITVTASSNPSVNISHYWISPAGGTLTMNNNPALFVPGQPGTYTHVTINNINGCFDTKTFTVSSTSGFPTFSVSSPQNFTLGCGSKSLATIDIVNAQTTPTPGGAVSYTILSPTSTTNYIPGTQVSYTVNIPGTYTVITKDNTNFCESKAQISVLQQTFTPDISANVPSTLLTCYAPSVILEGVSTNTNTTYLWSFPGNPGNVSGSTITVVSNSATISNTLIANYTLTITDNNNTCKSFSVIPMLQNLFPPLVAISGGASITCNTPTLVFTNQASSSIPAVFPHPLFVQAYSWTGPSPQEELQLSTTYTVATPGTYTLIGRDLNNGCFAIGTKTLDDFRDYPEVLKTENPFILDCGDNAKAIFPTTVGNTTGLTYSWTSVVGSSVSSVTSRTLSVNRSGQYSIIITNTLNGCSSNAMLEVIGGSLQAAFVADFMTGYAPLAVSFTNTSYSSSTLSPNANIASYWNFGNATTFSSTTQNTAGPIVYTQPGTYKAVLYSIKGECLDSAFVNIKVEVPSELSIPNIFTPNGDGNNDLFFLKATNLEKIDMMITDRWGNKVYELNSSSGNVAWDGKNQFGKESPAGVYLYTLKASGTDGTSYDKKGTITLVR